MKFLSIRQPYSSLIIAGFKAIENRDWSSLPHYRGPVAIHAGLKRADLEAKEIRRVTKAIGQPIDTLPHYGVTGAIIGVAWLADAWWVWDVPKAIKRTQRAFICGDACLHFSEAWVLPEPIPMKGRLGLVELPENIGRLVSAQFRFA